jgi:Rho termination factor-like protein
MMAEEFSAQVYLQMDAKALKAEAEKYNIDPCGKNASELADAVYNAELTRQHVEKMKKLNADKAAVVETEDEPQLTDADLDDEIVLEDMTIAQLRTYAAENNIGLGDFMRKADIISAIREQQGEAD